MRALVKRISRVSCLDGVVRLLYEVRRKITGREFIAEADITDNCNLKCTHCYHFTDREELQKKEISLEVWRERFETLYREGIRMVFLVGGEPAIRQDVLFLAHEIFPCIDIITNGTIRIPEEFHHRLFVSVDGSESTSEKIRGEGTFRKILENYRGDRRVILNMTLMRDNFRELEDVVKTSLENGFQGVVCNLYTSTAKDAESDPELITGDVRASIISELRRIKRLYPETLMLTERMIKWFEDEDHRDFCYWRDSIRHYTVEWERRKCFADADCSKCGCFAGAFGTPFGALKTPVEMLRFFVKQ